VWNIKYATGFSILARRDDLKNLLEHANYRCHGGVFYFGLIFAVKNKES